VTVARRLFVALFALVLAAGPPGACLGWMATPEARMACCAGHQTTHGQRHHEHGTARDVTQAEADRCCATSDREDTAPSPVTATPVMTPGADLSAVIVVLPDPARHWTFSQGSAGTVPLAHVARHLLLSVFLV